MTLGSDLPESAWIYIYILYIYVYIYISTRAIRRSLSFLLKIPKAPYRGIGFKYFVFVVA